MSSVLAALLAMASVVAGAPARADEVGFVGNSYYGGSDTPSAPTGQKPQSKLWHHDGLWWAVMYSPQVRDWHIYSLVRTSQTWVDTGVLVDERPRPLTFDVLWDGSKLYVASAGNTATGRSTRVTRFSYDASTRTYAKDAAFPVSPLSGGAEAIVIDKDSTGSLWLTYTRSSKVWVTHSDAAQTSWVAPYVLPVTGADPVSADDISSVIAFGGNKIGVLWGNQTADTYFFAVHVDGDPDSQWSVEVAYSSPEGADDHMNLKVIPGDPQGRVFAAVKTSKNHTNDPLNILLVRGADGVWDTDNVVGRAGENESRVQVMLDTQNQDVYTFAAAPCCSGGTIYMKKAALSALGSGNPFPVGTGTVVMQSTGNPAINNPSSTKQTVDDGSDLVVLAADDTTDRYVHSLLTLGSPDTSPPQTTIDSGPSGTQTSGSAAFTFSADEPGSTFECSLDSAPFAPCWPPATYSNLASGDHTFAVRASDPDGNTDPTPATSTWTVQVPLDTSIDTGPSGTTGDPQATFTFSANMAGATFACSLDGEPAVPCTSPITYSGLSDTEHTFTVAATVGDVSDETPAGRTWTVDATPTITTDADQDATVSSGAPTTGYGTATFLESDSPDRQAYVRFTLAGVPATTTVASATLRLYSTNGSGNGPKVYATQTGWSEGSLTWNTRPALLSNTPVADKGSTPTGAWVSYDVTSAVTGNGTFSFALVPDSTDGVVYTSHEGGVAPQLLVQTEAADNTPPDTSITSGPSGTSGSSVTFEFASSEPSSSFECSLDGGDFTACASPWTLNGLASGPHAVDVRAIDRWGNADPAPAHHEWTVDAASPVTFTASADAQVASASPATNYGSTTTLDADASPLLRSYVGFDVAGLSGAVTSAVLRLYVSNATVNGPAVYAVGSPWTESTLTWNTQPTLGASALSNVGSVAAGAWVQYDVTAAVASAVSGSGPVSFALLPESSDGMTANSRQASANRPQLVVTAGG